MMSGNKVMKTTLSFEQPLNSCLIEHTSALKQGDKRFINMIRYILFPIILLLSMSTQSFAQNCDFQTGVVSFDARGGNTTSLYNTQFALTNLNGDILQISDETSFIIDDQGYFAVFAVNYLNTGQIVDFEVGSNINIVAGDCVDISAPITFSVCEALEPCNFCVGENVVLDATGGTNDPDFTTVYVLVDDNGEIVAIEDNPEFGMLSEGVFVAFAITFETAAGIDGLEIGEALIDIESTCHDISEGIIVDVCEILTPTIFFDLQGCNITETAILAVEEGFDNVLWSTGSTETFIVVDANLPMTYTVTVSLESGCTGTASQEITGNEVASIGDFVWEDNNGNGLQDPNESGVNGVTVNLFADFNNDGQPDIPDFASCTTTTSNNPTTGEPGYYSFDVYEASYVVQFVAPSGFTFTPQAQGGDRTIDSDVNPSTGLSNTIAINAGQNILDIDAGFFTTSGLGGVVFNDANANGIFDDDEMGIDGVEITLFDVNGEVVGTLITSTDPTTGEVGAYCFDDLAPSAFFAEITLPDGNVLSPANSRSDDDLDSDADESNGPNTTSTFDIAPGVKTDNVDFGTYEGGMICGIVWQETGAEENSVFNEGVDTPLEGTQLELISLDNDNEVIQVATTGADGSYCFTAVPTGSFQVRPRASSAGDSYVEQGVGDDPLLDSDIDPNTITSDVFFLDPGETLLGINAGLRFGALPIELINFTGFWDRGFDEIVLEWSTAVEINNEKFIIERVVGESGNFEEIGEVAGAGNSTSVVSYTLSDEDIALSANYYYRLKQVDFDGGFEYSDIIVVTVERNESVAFNIYPNPAVNFVTVDVTLDAGALASAYLTDIRGRVIKVWSDQGIYKNNSTLTLSIDEVPLGQYMLSVKVGTEVHNSLLLVTK